MRNILAGVEHFCLLGEIFALNRALGSTIAALLLLLLLQVRLLHKSLKNLRLTKANALPTTPVHERAPKKVNELGRIAVTRVHLCLAVSILKPINRSSLY